MAVFATGFTKSLATSISGKTNAAQRAATMQRSANRKQKDAMPAIIEGDRRRGIPPFASARKYAWQHVHRFAKHAKECGVGSHAAV